MPVHKFVQVVQNKVRYASYFRMKYNLQLMFFFRNLNVLT